MKRQYPLLRRIVVCIAAVSVALLLGCEDESDQSECSSDTSSEQTSSSAVKSVEGKWAALLASWDGSVQTNLVSIAQDGAEVSFLEDSDEIGTGTISDNTIHCDTEDVYDFWGLGISTIYILGGNEMKSDTPTCEAVDALRFVR